MENYTLRERIAGDLASWLKIWKPDWTLDRSIKLGDVIRLVWSYQGLRAALIYRFSYHLNHKRVKALPGILSRLNLTLHGFDIPSSVDIGPGLYVPHPVGTVITAQKIGANISLISNITIGMRNERAFPTIGNNVFVGAGARILGNIVIGDNVNIGANSVVIHDIPANCTVVGIPAKIISNKVDLAIS